MNHENKFSVSRFRNRNGVLSFRVEGRLNGVRIRRNFKTLEEAATEKAALELKSLQIGSNLQAVTTCLAEDQVREAEAAFRRLDGNTRSLAFYLDFALSNYREPVCQKPLSEAAEAYLEVKSQEHERQVISAPQLTTIRRHLEVLRAHFPGATVAELSASRLTAYFQHDNPALKTYNNRRGVVSTGGALVPFFALCLFAGIRPCVRTGEILRLRPEHVRLDTGVIHIEPEVSKVRMKRNVSIQPNLAAWLMAYPLDRYPIVVPALQKHRAKVARVFGLSHDVMRHTFISFFVAKFRSMGEAALQAGNSEAIIRKHYLDLKTPTEAEEFFNIRPGSRQGVIAFPLAV